MDKENITLNDKVFTMVFTGNDEIELHLNGEKVACTSQNGVIASNKYIELIDYIIEWTIYTLDIDMDNIKWR